MSLGCGLMLVRVPIMLGDGPSGDQQAKGEAVSYTHLTLPTSDLV